MTEPLIEIRGLIKTFGGITATNNVSLTLAHGEVHAIIGPNGAGKTTLIGQITGELKPNAGTIWLGGQDITHETVAARARLGLARSFQITSLFLDFSVLDNVALAIQAKAGHSFRFWHNARTDHALRGPARDILDRLGLSRRADALASELSYGEQRQLELAMALATRPRALLLDEPMAGIGHEETGRIIDLLKGLKSDYAILLIEHDMNAVFALADRISVLVHGAIIASGPPDEIRNNSDVKRAYLGEERSNRRRAAPQERAHG